MTQARENLRRAIEEYLSRRYPGTRWSVGLRGDEPIRGEKPEPPGGSGTGPCPAGREGG
jgi:hypothetical protein